MAVCARNLPLLGSCCCRRRQRLPRIGSIVARRAAEPAGNSERQEQRAYSEREIIDSLGEGDLVPVEVIDFDPFKDAADVGAKGVKLFFVCRRR